MDAERIERTAANLRQRLLDELRGDHWEGELSSSALSTATATIALTLAHRREGAARFDELARHGGGWLVAAQNDDGGWGDTDRSFSNISTTALCWAAVTMRRETDAASRAASYMERHAGGLDPGALSAAIKKRYGKDQTFSVPILTVLAIAELLGDDGWRLVPQLPFELAAFPQRWYAALQLPVVSYALPALIAIGQARHARRPSRNPATRSFRNSVRERTLAKLESIQPSNGGFLEATPLTSFVTMSLITAGRGDHAVVRLGLDFLEKSVRADGSWPIDTNLATWGTTLAVNALAAGGRTLPLDKPQRAALHGWLLTQQFKEEHPYTGAAPGGWAWTDLPGGVPDADDTPGALLAIQEVSGVNVETLEAARLGVRWLLDLQNADGGIPTFCRGWGALPFDRSSPDLTAHTLRAWLDWRGNLPTELERRLERAIPRAVRYLLGVQRPNGAWSPLWFGNQHAPDELNLTYGTARVLGALTQLAGDETASAERAAEAWLLKAQRPDGGWGGAPGTPPSIEETSLAVSALASRLRRRPADAGGGEAVERGLAWLVTTTDEGRRTEPSPIGFYFAKLWYFERLYPLVFALEAFHAARPESS